MNAQQRTQRDVGICAVQEGIPTSLLKLTTENMGRAIKMFGGVQKYMLPDSGPPDGITPLQRLEIAGKLLHQAVRRPELKDELYMQVGSMDTCPPTRSEGLGSS